MTEGEPLNPISLPPELAELLARQPTMVCLTHGTDQGTVYVLKAPNLARIPQEQLDFDCAKADVMQRTGL